jgi:hypothetical protein
MNESTGGQKPNLRIGNKSQNELKAMGTVETKLNSLKTNVIGSRSRCLAVRRDGLACHRMHARGGSSTGFYNLGKRDRCRRDGGCFNRITIESRAESPHFELFADRTVCRVSSDVSEREKTAPVRSDPSKLLTSLPVGSTNCHIDCVCRGACVVVYRAKIWWLSVELRRN